MGKNYSKVKGKAFEQEVAKILTNVFDKKFMRVPNSGAYVGGKNKKRIKELDNTQIDMFKGDIIPPSDFDIVIECKFYKEFTGGFEHVLQQRSQILTKWLSELQYDAEDKFHMLFMKFNNKGIFFGLPINNNSELVYFISENFITYHHGGKIYLFFHISRLNHTTILDFILRNIQRIDHVR